MGTFISPYQVLIIPRTFFVWLTFQYFSYQYRLHTLRNIIIV